MLATVLTKLTSRLEAILSNFQNDLTSIRSNRANPGMVDGVEVEAYGGKMKLRDLAHISCPEPRMIVVQPWDATQVETIAKGLGSAGLGINPAVDGQTIRLPLPPLTEERRAELVKIVKGKLEEARVAVRQARQDSVQALDRGEKEGQISEDEVKRGQSQIQKAVDEVVIKLESLALAKEAEVMTV